jgi:hypothetical protein
MTTISVTGGTTLANATDSAHVVVSSGTPAAVVGGMVSGPLIAESATNCYCAGTLIATERGAIAVEGLEIGHRLMTVAGVARPIKWIGRSSYSGRVATGRTDILPVCIKAGALADDVPSRDLWISPNHAMYFKDEHGEGALIEAKDLVNSLSIVQAQSVEQLEYFHVELETHDVIVAEGALAETFIGDDDRARFHNAHEYWRLYPEAASEAAAPARYCAPRLESGYQLEAVQRRLVLRAGLGRGGDDSSLGELRGFIDLVSADSIEGWAQDADHPEAPVCLDVYAGEVLLGQVLANRYREGLADFTKGSGRHSFVFTPPNEVVFDPANVEVRRSLDGAALRRGKHTAVAA